MVRPEAGDVQQLFQMKYVVLQWIQARRATGMSGDVPGWANHDAEIFMRVFFGPLLPAWAHAR
jgi:hypothetical protein